jgi:hypothetical protein
MSLFYWPIIGGTFTQRGAALRNIQLGERQPVRVRGADGLGAVRAAREAAAAGLSMRSCRWTTSRIAGRRWGWTGGTAGGS